MQQSQTSFLYYNEDAAMEDLDVWWFGAPVRNAEFKRFLMTYREGDRYMFGKPEVSLTYRPPEEPRLDIIPRDPSRIGNSSLPTNSRQHPEDRVSVFFGERDGGGNHPVPEKLKNFISNLAVGSIIKYNGTWIEIIEKQYEYFEPSPEFPGYVDIGVTYRSFKSA